jgi:predicted DNA-binding transcriptional regulator AlpA
MSDLIAQPLLTERELAERLGVTIHTVRRWRYLSPPQGPPVRKLGRAVRYSVAEVEAWLDDEQDPWWRDG